MSTLRPSSLGARQRLQVAEWYNIYPNMTAAEACANCGKEEKDNAVKLKNCTACLLVKYRSVDCQKIHRNTASSTRRHASSVLPSSRTRSCTARVTKDPRPTFFLSVSLQFYFR